MIGKAGVLGPGSPEESSVLQINLMVSAEPKRAVIEMQSEKTETDVGRRTASSESEPGEAGYWVYSGC